MAISPTDDQALAVMSTSPSEAVEPTDDQATAVFSGNNNASEVAADVATDDKYAHNPDGSIELRSDGKPMMNITIHPADSHISNRPDDAPSIPKISASDFVGSFTDPDTGKPYSLDDIKDSPFYTDGMFDPQNALTDPSSLLGRIGKTGFGTLLAGAMDVPRAVEQIGAHIASAVGSNPATQKLADLTAQVANYDYTKNWKGEPWNYQTMQPQTPPSRGQEILRGVGSALVPIPGIGAVAGGATKLADAAIGGGANIFAKTVAAAGTGAVVGATASPLLSPSTKAPPGQITPFAGQKLQQAEEGAAGGALLAPAGQAVGATIAKGFNAIKGVMPAAYQELKAVADKYGIWDKFSVGNVTHNPGVVATEHALEKVPTSIGGLRGKESSATNAALGAVKQYNARQHDDIINANFKNVGEIEKAAADPTNRRNDAAKKILERMNKNDDLNQIIRNSAEGNKVRAALVSDKLYAAVEALGGEKQVKVGGAIGAVNEMLDHLRKTSGSSNDAAIKELTRIKADLQNPEKTTYMGLRRTVSDLEQSAKALGKNDPVTARAYTAASTAIDADLDKVGDSALKAAAVRADNNYKNNIAPLKALEIDKLKNDQQVYQKFITSSDTGQAQDLYNALDDKGRAAVRVGMVRDALNQAIEKSGGVDAKTGKYAPESGKFNPKDFNTALGNIQAARGVFFKGTDKFELDGLQKILFHLSPPATSKMTNPIIYGLFAGEGLMGHVSSSVLTKTAVVPSVLSWLFTSPAGKRILLASSDIGADSPAMAALVQKIPEQFSKVAASYQGNKVNRVKP